MGILDWMVSGDKNYSYALKKLRELQAHKDADTAAGQAAIAEAQKEVDDALAFMKQQQDEKEDS
jgi:hypothetical protein